jgi:uncharacterized protein (TIGR02677 family)
VSAVPDNAAIQAFAYIGAEKAPLYRTIMRLFMESKERFVFSLRAEDVFEVVRNSAVGEILEQAEVETALAQLCEWGNLQTHADTTDVDTVEDFFKQRHAFQITSQGEAAERASALLQTTSKRETALQSTALADVRHVIEELKQLAREPELDAGKIHRNLLMLHARFEDLTATAQAFIGRLERRIQLQPADARQLIEFAERFIGELVLAADSIGEAVRDIEAAGFERLLHAAAERSAGDGMDQTAEDVAAVCGQWRSQWECFCNWFISQPDRPSTAEKLRERARASIPVLLSVTTRINDRRFHRIDRANDFRVLARWFAEAESDDQAHRLWRAAFGLGSARHLIINDATLDDHEAQDVSANTSWLDAPPLRISMRLRDYSNNSRTGMLSRIIDRTEEKEKLAAATREEALRILNAQSRFGTGRRMRLSELDHLETAEFDLFLDLLGEAVSARVFSAEPVEILSGDGCLRVKLEPTEDGRKASISTTEGIFSGPDYWISIEALIEPPEV